jgi:hypothetical protein
MMYLVHVCNESGPLLRVDHLQPELNERLASFGNDLVWTSSSSLRGTFCMSMRHTFLVFPVRDQIISIYFW